MANIEVEVKYIIDKNIFDKILNYFKDKKIIGKVKKQNDIYFSPEYVPFFGGEIDDECLRIRVLDEKNILSYKRFVEATQETPSYCIEHEIVISDLDMMKKILNDLRIKEVFTLKKERVSFIWDDLIEVSLDNVDELGYFVEIEVINSDMNEEGYKKLLEFADKFSLTEEMRNYDGYSYLLYNKNN